MKEILMQYFSVKLDENGQTLIKLPALSEFWELLTKSLYFDGNTFKQAYSYMNSYVLFVNQHLTLEQFIGEDAIFVGENLTEDYIDAMLFVYKTIEEAINYKEVIYINPDKI